MKTHANRILAGLLATALPSVALAQDTATQAEPAGATTLGSFEGVADTVDSENLRLHTVQRKSVSDGGKHEVVLYPAIAQLNSKFTSHLGAGAQYLYHLHENFALQAQGMYFYVSEQTAFTEELINTGRQAPQAATALTLLWAATGGFEVTPIYGKFAFYEGSLASFGLVLSAGAGVGGTQIQLQGASGDNGATFGDTGMKFVGQVGAGFRVRLNENFLVRLEVKDLVYTAKVDAINGCNLEDLTALHGGKSAVNASCADADFQQSGDVNLAKRLIEEPSSDVLNNVGVYGGVSYTF
ncbi:outer membrane beta-barrel domain-containing protein [Vulgatibacter sp.]|uniref:outer membrane beta-barrel domain-containing protein n=1 Tax=Vulgatibacter sp. TaxID=1971226 RepID=UPI00356161E9